MTFSVERRLAFSVPLLEAPRIIDFFFDYFFLAREEKKVIAFGQEGLVASALHRCPATVAVVDIFFRCAFSLYLYLVVSSRFCPLLLLQLRLSNSRSLRVSVNSSEERDLACDASFFISCPPYLKVTFRAFPIMQF